VTDSSDAVGGVDRQDDNVHIDAPVNRPPARRLSRCGNDACAVSAAPPPVQRRTGRSVQVIAQ